MVTVERHICVGTNLLFLHLLSLITLERYDVCAGFPADIFVFGKDWPPSPSLIKMLTSPTLLMLTSCGTHSKS